MNYLIAFLLVLMLAANAKAQPLALSNKAIDDDLAYSSLANYHMHRHHHKIKPIVVAGICLTSVGAGTAVVGVYAALFIDGDIDAPGRRKFLEIAGAGAVVAAAGAALLIEALVQHRRARYGFNIVSPKMNEIGLAYNF